MKRTICRVICLLLVLLLVLSLIPSVSAASTATVGTECTLTILSGQNGDTAEDPKLESGSLPPGMSLGVSQNTVTLYGTPSTAGTYSGSVSAAVNGSRISGEFTVEVSEAAASSGTAPVITKQPTGETVDEGGSATFVANATGWVWCAWRFVSPDGETEIIFDKVDEEFAGLVVNGGNYTTLQLSNIPASLNGWKAVCLFSSAEDDWSYTDGSAVITVNSAATPTPSPSPTPTESATPSPSPSPTPTPTPTPTAAPTAVLAEETASPTPSPTPEPEKNGTGSGTAALLIIGIVMIVICVTVPVLIFRKRRDEREEAERAARRARSNTGTRKGKH